MFSRLVAFTICLVFVSNAHAWVHRSNVKIKNIIQWQDNAPVYITLSDNLVCFLPAGEKNLYSMVLSAYVAQKTIDIHCNDSKESYGGVEGHRIHRFISN